MADVDMQLDETLFYRPDIAQAMGGIHVNNVLWYFAESPFYSQQSNNQEIRTRAFNPALQHTVSTWAGHEDALSKVFGTQFVLTDDPSDSGRNPEHNGIWVLRKQERSRPSRSSGTVLRPGELPPTATIEPLNHYYAKRDYLYQAPSIGDIVGNRMLLISQCLNRSLTALEDLVEALDEKSKAGDDRPQAGNRAIPSSFQLDLNSKEGTPVPEASQPSSAAKSFQPGVEVGLDANLLGKSLMLSVKHQDEFMDENPLRGEPGSFVMQKSRTDKTLVKPSEVKVAAPLQVKTNIESSPAKTSKDSAKSPITPGGTKKRKKSRLLQSATPK